MLKKIFYGVVLLLSALLFVGGANDESSRLTKAVWDTGHLFLFAGFVWLLMENTPLKTREMAQQLWFVLCFALVVGSSIEILQFFVGRYLELMDVLFDVLGGMLGWLLFSAQQARQPSLFLIKMSPFIFLIISIVFWPVWRAYQDQMLMEGEFPILADFENANELSRWEANETQLLLQSMYVRHGESALAVNFAAVKYPSIALHALQGDWREYQYLKLSVFNPQNKPRRLSLKIYDRQHPHNGYRYEDRFNTQFMIKAGWNEIVVALDDIRLAPKGREMEMADIVDVSLFLQNQKQPVQLFFDYVRLSQ